MKFMLKNKNVRIISLFLVVVFLIAFSPIVSKAEQIPVIPIEEVEDFFTPDTYNDWDYYVVPPGTEYSDVIYRGGSVDNLDVDYTDLNLVWEDFDIEHPSSDIKRGDVLSTNPLLTDDLRDSNHPFFNDTFYPRAVRFPTHRETELVNRQTSSLSLHMDYSSTFFADGWVTYYGYVNTSVPFFLDVSVSNSKVWGLIGFESAHPATGYIFGDPEQKMTFPFIPIDEGVQTFMLFTNVSTLVTLTPHEWKFPSWMPSLDLDSVFTEEFDQGEKWSKDEDTDELVKPDNEMFSIRLFNLSLMEDHYYQINTIFDMEEVKPGVLSATPAIFLIGEHFEVISGSIASGEVQIHAKESEGVILAMISLGEAHGVYSIFFQEKLPEYEYETEPLNFNRNITLETEIYYTFTLTNPTVIRANESGSFAYDIMVQGAVPGEWIDKSDDGFITDTWRYFPAGAYAIEVTSFTIGSEIFFASVPIRSTSSSPISVDQNSILAFELPLTRNRINFVNISTSDPKNQSITYNYRWISKYNELVTGTGSDNPVEIGNQQTNGVWNAYPTFNDTTLREFLPVLDYDAPILLLTTVEADNTTHTITKFDGTVRVTTNEAVDQSFAYRTIWSTYSSSFSGTDLAGVFIPKSPITASKTYPVNMDNTANQNQVFGVPMNLDPYYIYNISAILTGNWSTTSSLNVTFGQPIRAMGANLRDLRVFEAQSSGSNDLQAWRSMLILTVSDPTYLYIDIFRTAATRNGTLQILIEKLPARHLEFDIDQEYNDTVSDTEVKSTGLIVKQITPSEMKKATPAFEMIVGIVALASISGFLAKKRRN
jgi:hypothetical protein